MTAMAERYETYPQNVTNGGSAAARLLNNPSAVFIAPLVEIV